MNKSAEWRTSSARLPTPAVKPVTAMTRPSQPEEKTDRRRPAGKKGLKQHGRKIELRRREKTHGPRQPGKMIAMRKNESGKTGLRQYAKTD
jgi:hypothetical protein